MVRLEPGWWKRKDHRGIRGARGARFASLSFHCAFLVSTFIFIEYIFHRDEIPVMHFPDPPVPAPPPLAKSVSHTLASEMPHLKSLEVEQQRPSHVPQRDGLDFRRLRTEGKLS